MTESAVSGRPPSIAPEFAESRFLKRPDGVRLRVYALRGPTGERPALLWGHANGFAAGSYLPFLQSLTEHFRVFAFDARGHGGSDVPSPPLSRTLHIDRYAADLGAVAALVAEETGSAPLYFASHSFSGVAALRLGAVQRIAPWAGVMVIEPPVVPTPDVPEHEVAVGKSQGLIAMAQRRRRQWASPEAYFESLVKRPPYSDFRPDMLAAHCRATLMPTGEGDYTLCCAPETEIATYTTVLNSSTFRALPRFPVAVHVVAADPAPPGGHPSWAALVQPAVAERLPKSRISVVRGASHMVPFEFPERCRELLLETAAGRIEHD